VEGTPRPPVRVVAPLLAGVLVDYAELLPEQYRLCADSNAA
jgi:hypothetical protein